MVTARRGRGAYPPRRMDITAVERSFAELLAAFGDLVVARAAGAPAEPTRRARQQRSSRRYRARRRAFDAALDALDDVAAATRTSGRWPTCAGVLAWLDEGEPTPGRATGDHGVDGRGPGDPAPRARVTRRYGAAAAAVPVGPSASTG